MEVSQLLPSSSITAPSVRGRSQEDQFLALMIQQLRSQDPLEPIGNGEFLEQVSQFSQMEQFEALNQNLVQMLALQSELAGLEQLSEATGLIGHEVEFHSANGEAKRAEVDSVRLENGFVRLDAGGETFSLADLISVHGKASSTVTQDRDQEEADKA